MPSQPASGSRILFGIAREAYPGEGRVAANRYLRVNLPNAVDVMRPENPSGAINPSGYAEPGIPGPVSIPADFGLPLTAADLLELAENLFGAATKATVETGVYRYTHTADPSGILPTLSAILCLPPTENRRRFYGGRVPTLQLAVGNNVPIQLRMPGAMFAHTTTLGEAVEDAVAGTYTGTPQVRGVAGMAPRQSLWFLVKSKASNVPTIQFEACPVGGTPEFPSNQPGYAATYDSDGRMKWLNAQGAVQLTGTVSVTASAAAVTGVGTAFDTELAVGDSVIIENEVKVVSAIGSATGLTLSTNHTAGASGAVILAYNRDLGVVAQDDHNIDPLQILLPGTTTQHADLAVNDSWMFPLRDDWDDPTVTYDTDPRKLTSANLVVEYQRVGASTWTELRNLSSTIAMTWPLTVDQGDGSKYPQSLDRDTESGGTITLVRKLRDAAWDTIKDEHGRVNLRLTWSSQLLGTTGTYREQIRITALGAVQTRTRPAANPQAVQETITFRCETNSALAAPITLEIWTPRDYTVATTPA